MKRLQLILFSLCSFYLFMMAVRGELVRFDLNFTGSPGKYV